MTMVKLLLFNKKPLSLWKYWCHLILSDIFSYSILVHSLASIEITNIAPGLNHHFLVDICTVIDTS